MKRKRSVLSLKKSLELALPILKSAVRQLKIFSPQNGTWQNFENESYLEETEAIEAIESYLKFLSQTKTDVKIKAKEKKDKPQTKDKTILYPEDCL